MEPLRQCAALAYIATASACLVLLITTRRRGRWTIPKGWRKLTMSDADLEAREALEEGGVEGKIGKEPLGTFDYTKRLHFFSWARCRVAVYPLRVDRQLLTWREKASRTVLWVPPERAAELVGERQLAELLRAFAQSGPPRN
jgi:8-oxo-dGTP pyrophosphatase MutT (NUDIX family)